MYRLATLVRGALVSAIFNKTLKLKASEAQKAAAVTLMSTDIDGIEQGLVIGFGIWASLIELAIAAYLLATLVGGASFLVVIPALSKSPNLIVVRKLLMRVKIACSF